MIDFIKDVLKNINDFGGYIKSLGIGDYFFYFNNFLHDCLFFLNNETLIFFIIFGIYFIIASIIISLLMSDDPFFIFKNLSLYVLFVCSCGVLYVLYYTESGVVLSIIIIPLFCGFFAAIFDIIKYNLLKREVKIVANQILKEQK